VVTIHDAYALHGIAHQTLIRDLELRRRAHERRGTERRGTERHATESPAHPERAAGSPDGALLRLLPRRA
jgi:hypothetical protein